MTQIFENLFNSDVLSEDVRQSITEAWNRQLVEAREQITAELREEFASRYENDKSQIVEAMDAMLTDTIKSELNEFAADKRALVEERAKYKRAIKEHARTLDEAVNNILRKELTELKEDQRARKKNLEKLEEFVLAKLTQELNEFKIDRRAVQEERANYKRAIKEHAEKLDRAINETLTKEMAELREDRAQHKQNVNKLEEFVNNRLVAEMTEFQADKKALVEQRVRMVKEGKRVIAEARAKFIKTAAAKVEKLVEGKLRSEIRTLKEDIKLAKENNFGRKIFETFAAEFMTNALSEGTQVAKLSKRIQELDKQLKESQDILVEKDRTIMEARRAVRVAEDMSNRKAILAEMMNPLSKDQREVMGDLLESVKTEKLREAFDKYLPTVLSESVPKTSRNKAKLTEGQTVVTGDRASRTQTETEGSAEIIRIRQLAGLS